ncbi:putative RNase H-like nuclease [Anaerosolibacter carboniphilus]|uniref:Putative RNase H-like nuclease n=1 Tax=Anaerosolibacter carboniphilus TaxID=1417629 RepID=A0A841KNR4_9FIRM|nr:DUF429 domain-containing protein [Anaerosolibacter carboniphilus]MBB6215067.1 putative RNase H-like nuclease [Anaerosolibacter carboniphilus]
MGIRIIGIDCAADHKKVGMSFGTYSKGYIELVKTEIASSKGSIASVVHKWIDDSSKVLIAIDAPLGWPLKMGQYLANHNAGDVLSINANDLFRRETDKFIKKKLGKQPLDVGADKIARTAHSALTIINELRQLTGKSIRLAWNNEEINDIAVIEVYPAATLDRYGITNLGYKKKEQKYIRQEMINQMKRSMVISIDTDIMENNDDVLDSAVCLLAAKDFIEGNVYWPEDIELAKKEGWIWVRNIK